MENKKYKKLGRDLGIASIIFTLCICLAMGCIGYATYYQSMRREYRKYVSGILNFASSALSGDDIEEYINEGNDLVNYDVRGDILDHIWNNFKIYDIYLEKADKDTPSDSDIRYKTESTKYGHLYVGALSILDHEGDAVAVLTVELSVNDVKTSVFKYAKTIAIAAIINAILFCLSLFLWVRKRVVKPIKKLEASANTFVKSCHNDSKPSDLVVINPGINSGDEIQALSDSLIVMSEDLKQYMNNLLKETSEKERIASELRIAAHIQASMLPCIFPPFPERPEFNIYASMNPAKEVGGDFYDFFILDDDHIGFVMADVSGKGIPAALFMVIGKTLIKEYSGFGDSLGDVFTKVNELLCEANTEELFITAFEGILNFRTGELEFVNAGHEKPIIYHKDEDRWEVYPTRAAFVLAGMEGMKYRSGKMNIKKGDRIFLYTDGVTEAVNTKNEQYGMERLQACLAQNSETELEDMLVNIRKDVDKFADGTEQFDDITMLCLELNV